MEILYQPYAAQSIQAKQLPLRQHNLRYNADFIKGQRSGERKSPIEDRNTQATTSPRLSYKFAIESDIGRQHPGSAFNEFNRPCDSFIDTFCSSSDHQNSIPKFSFFDSPNKEKNMDTSIDDDNHKLVKTAENSDISSASKSLVLRKEMRKTPAKESSNSRCVMLQYFNGNSADEVEQHFRKALKKPSTSCKESVIPMARRKLPASFWDSSYKFSNNQYTECFTSPFHFHSSVLSDLLRPHPFLANRDHFSSSHSSFSFFSKLRLLQSTYGNLSPLQNRFNPVFNAALNSPTKYPSHWQTFAGFQSSFSGQILNSHRTSAATDSAPFPGLFNQSSVPKVNQNPIRSSKSIDNNSLFFVPPSNRRDLKSCFYWS